MQEAAADMGDKAAMPSQLLVSVYDTARSKLATQTEVTDENERSQVRATRHFEILISRLSPTPSSSGPPHANA